MECQAAFYYYGHLKIEKNLDFKSKLQKINAEDKEIYKLFICLRPYATTIKWTIRYGVYWWEAFGKLLRQFGSLVIDQSWK